VDVSAVGGVSLVVTARCNTSYTWDSHSQQPHHEMRSISVIHTNRLMVVTAEKQHSVAENLLYQIVLFFIFVEVSMENTGRHYFWSNLHALLSFNKAENRPSATS